jgi:uncharacterized protein involved in exopolysaccharide biosynthesis
MWRYPRVVRDYCASSSSLRAGPVLAHRANANVHSPKDELDLTSANLFEPEQVRNYLQFVFGSIRRRRKLAASVFVSIAIMAMGVLAILPRTYHVEAKLLAQRSQVLAIRGDSPDATVAPTRGAAETVKRRDNLIAIIQATDLVRHYHEHRAFSQRILDSMRGMFSRAESEPDQVDDMVDLLDKRLNVWTNEDTVSIGIDWPDAPMAARIVDISQKNFLDARHAQEITALIESIAIVRGHAASLQSDIDVAVAALDKLRGQRQPANDSGETHVAPMARAASAAHSSSSPQSSPDLVALKESIDAKQHSVDELEAVRKRRLSESQANLDQQRTTLTDNHPVVVELRKATAALAIASPEVAAKRDEIAKLEADYASKRGERRDDSSTTPSTAGATSSADATTPPALPSEILRLDSDLRDDRDPMIVYAKGQLRDAMEKYSALRAQVQAAQIELETAEAAFKYRYSVLTPAEVPRRPVKPNVLLLLLLALFAAAALSIVVATVADVRAGRLVERWQIETILGRPILGELDLPQLTERGSE